MFLAGGAKKDLTGDCGTVMPGLCPDGSNVLLCLAVPGVALVWRGVAVRDMLVGGWEELLLEVD